MILNDNQCFFLHVLWVLTKEKIKFFFKNQLESQGEPIIGFPFIFDFSYYQLFSPFTFPLYLDQELN